MTGAEIKQLLETGLVVANDAGVTDYLPFISAGLDAEKLEDGEVYTVVFSPSDCGEKSQLEKTTVPSDIVWKEFWREYIIGLGTITPDSVK